MTLIKPIAFTPGDPGGIGPELLLKLSSHHLNAPVVAITSYQLLQERAQQIGTTADFPLYDETNANHPPISIFDVPLTEPSVAGKLNPKHAHYVLDTIKLATAGCQENKFAALTTGPISKANINSAGISFTGHTEFLATLTGTPKTVMMLTNASLSVALLTTHVPLSAVSALVTKENIISTLRIICQDLREKFSIAKPRIMVCGLNPHAGENGHLGHEEQSIISPTLDILRKEGMDLIGPVPADTAFIEKNIKKFDVVLAMYHDQGLPVIKKDGFATTTNVTLGLPIIRTSVDHGTALDIAGTGQADESNLIAAINLAINLVKNKK